MQVPLDAFQFSCLGLSQVGPDGLELLEPSAQRCIAARPEEGAIGPMTLQAKGALTRPATATRAGQPPGPGVAAKYTVPAAASHGAAAAGTTVTEATSTNRASRLN